MSNKPRFSGEWVKLGDVLHVVHGKNQKAVEDQNGEYPIYGSGGQMGWASDYICPGDTVIIGRKGNINKPIYVSEPFWNVDTAFGLVPKPELLNARYLFHFCNFFNFETLNTTCTIPSLTRKNVEAIKLFLPPLEVQNERSVEFDTVLGQIVLAQGQLASLDSLVKSRFVEMFGDPCDPKNGKKKSRIDSFCELRIGPFGSALHKEDYVSNGHPVVNPSHIINGKVRPDQDLTIDDDKYKSLAAYQLFPGDVVLGRRGEIGRCAVVDKEGMICGTGSMILRPGQKVRSDYLQRVVSFPSFSRALENNAVGVTMKNLNAKIVGSAEVYLPKLKDQDAFAVFVSQIDKSRHIAQQQIEKLQTLYDSLAQEYFS